MNHRVTSSLLASLILSIPLAAQEPPSSSPPPLPPKIVLLPSTMAVQGMEQESPGKWKIELLNSSSKDICGLAFRNYSQPPGSYALSSGYPKLIPAGDTRNSYLQVEPRTPGDRRTPQRQEAERSFSISALYEDGSCAGEPEVCQFLIAEREGRRIEASIEAGVLRRALAAENVSKIMAVLQDLPDEAETRLLIEKRLDPRMMVPDRFGYTLLDRAVGEASTLRYDLQRELAQIIPLIPGAQPANLERLRSVLQGRLAFCERLVGAGN